MKTHIVAIMLLLIISACQSDIPTPQESPPSPNPISSPPDIYMQITAELTPHITRGDGGEYWEWRGRANTNLLGEVNLSLAHLVRKEADSRYSTVQDGYIYLWTDDHRNKLLGDYTGLGKGNRWQMSINGAVDIQYGHGTFATENGLLNLTITNSKLPSTDAVSYIQISGDLTSQATETMSKD